jgi:MurNAc alpha-1-phosphate uridylyltransferase
MIRDIHQALIFAAGLATRMRPLTDTMPKPLLEVQGKPLLTHIIEKLIAENVTHIVINGHHNIEKLAAYIQEVQIAYPQCHFILSEEKDLLETGGGAVCALPYLDIDAPAYIINGDAHWIDDNQPSLALLRKAWFDLGNSNALLLSMQDIETISSARANGDYQFTNEAQIKRSMDRTGTHMFNGMRICHPAIFNDYPLEQFSFLKIMDDCEAAQNLYGHNHKGQWFDISTPEDLKQVNDMLKIGICA